MRILLGDEVVRLLQERTVDAPRGDVRRDRLAERGKRGVVSGKRSVRLTALEPVGNYAVQPTFSDGHDTGIFSWDYLYFLGSQQADLWRKYEGRLEAAGANRDAPMVQSGGSACGHKH